MTQRDLVLASLLVKGTRDAKTPKPANSNGRDRA